MTAEIPQGFIDIHSHILPGLDDGPENMKQCIAMARRYRALGMHCVVATPHWYRFTSWSATPEQVIKTGAAVEQAVAEAGVALRILPGMEIGFTDRLEPALLESQLLCLGDSGYFLMEFPLSAPLKDPEQFILHLGDQQGQVRVILAHPERCASFMDNDFSLRMMTARGVLVQMNIASLLGGFGTQVQRTAVNMLRQGLVHFLATDAHAGSSRLPPDSHEWDRLTECIGAEAVAAACADNPRRLLNGEPVAPVRVDAERLDLYYSGHYTEKEHKIEKLAGSGLAGRLRKLFKE
jgi:protein-tyrosine phosphatase